MSGKTYAIRAFLASLIADGYECTVDEGRTRESGIVVSYADDLETERRVRRVPGVPGIRCEKEGSRLLIATADAAAAHALLAGALNELEELVS